MLYPEDQGNLNRVKDRPEHVFFKTFGQSMPAGAWNHPGTKQGVYMIGPNAEYLEGKFAASSDIPDMRRRLNAALTRWETLKKSKGYQNSPVPAVESTHPPGITGELVLRVYSRDLPRNGSSNPVRFNPGTDVNRGFTDYVRWAWNENWIGLPSASDIVPKGSGASLVTDGTLREICRKVLVDNVRGQVPEWQANQVQDASLTMTSTRSADGLMRIEYRGQINLGAGARSIRGTAYGVGEYDTAQNKFKKLNIVVTAQRTGSAQFNRRENDPGPAPIGFLLTAYLPK